MLAVAVVGEVLDGVVDISQPSVPLFPCPSLADNEKKDLISLFESSCLVCSGLVWSELGSAEQFLFTLKIPGFLPSGPSLTAAVTPVLSLQQPIGTKTPLAAGTDLLTAGCRQINFS